MRNFIKKFFFFFFFTSLLHPDNKNPVSTTGIQIAFSRRKMKSGRTSVFVWSANREEIPYICIYFSCENLRVSRFSMPSSPDNELPPFEDLVFMRISSLISRRWKKSGAKELWYKSPSDCKTQVRLWTMHVSLPDRLMPIPNRFFLLFSFSFSKVKLR